MLCATKSIVRPRRSRSSASRLSTVACTETSSAETGSSAIRISGSSASARAIEMRWRWPPENWRGKASSALAGKPDEIEQLAAALVDAGARHELVHAQQLGRAPGARSCAGLSDEYGSWKIICTRRRSAGGALGGEHMALDEHLARGRLVEADDAAPERRLAAARLAHEAERLAARDVQVDAVDGAQHVDGRLAHARARARR